ncbi:MAG: hypothetical protein MUC88_09165 [Planctomycetes bacterium]|jgi:hypothetical protein|nr:hypothetical protein [Planctomycetota bacterium]
MKHSRGHSEDASGAGAWEKAEQEGIDMASLQANLNRTVLERMRSHDRALARALTLRQAVAVAVAGDPRADGAPAALADLVGAAGRF